MENQGQKVEEGPWLFRVAFPIKDQVMPVHILENSILIATFTANQYFFL